MAATPKKGVQCKICNHPGRVQIDAMLLNGTPYSDIIRAMKAAHPGEEPLIPSNFSRHKSRHLLTQPIKLTEIDPETGQEQVGYLVGHLVNAPIVPKSAIPLPEERISVPDGLAIIINLAVRNALEDPSSVTIKDGLAAMDLARKLGLRGDDMDEFRSSWDAVTKKKSELRRRVRKRTVTVDEVEIEQGGSQEENTGEIIDVKPETAETVAPAEWSPEDLKLLEGPDEAEA